MGKFYEALKKSDDSKRQKVSVPISKKPAKISVKEIDASRLDISPSSGFNSKPDNPVSYDCKIDPRMTKLFEPGSVASECFKRLRTRLLINTARNPLKTIMVSSPEPLDGKTLIAANLGVTIAKGINEHVMLVDCDLRRPSLHKRLGINGHPGISEYLQESTSIASYIAKTNIEKLTLLPGGTIPPNPSELLSSSKMRALVQELKNRYKDRYIIFDSPPAQFTAETAFLASMVDGILMVVRAGKTSKNLVMEAINNIGRDKLIGIVFNANNEILKHYNYYYHRYYGIKSK